jgi:hypothetical protein
MTQQEIQSELERIKNTCMVPNWDTYGAKPISKECLQKASMFLGFAIAKYGIYFSEICCDPDGTIDLILQKDFPNGFLVQIDEDFVSWTIKISEQFSEGYLKLNLEKDREESDINSNACPVFRHILDSYMYFRDLV